MAPMERVGAGFAAVALSLLAGACGSSTDSGAPAPSMFPATPYATMISEAGKLDIEIRTSPEQPLERGLGAALLTISHQGTPIDGLELSVTPWMPAMAHGASIRPMGSAEGQGRYVIGNLGLFMPGLWQLRT